MKNQVKGQKGKGTSTPVEDPNSLRSNATGRLVDVISEGPIEGIVGGRKGIYFDRTPLKNDDDSENFEGVVVHVREGTPTQTVIPGFDATETEVSFNNEVTNALDVVKQINDADASAVRVRIQVPQLVHYHNNGDIKGTSVALEIHLKTNSGDYTLQQAVNIDGKTGSPYERSIRVELPEGGAPWSIKVVRVTPDSTDQKLVNATFWSGLTVLTDAKLSYPDTAVVGLEVDAKSFGSRIPERTYRVKGLITDVPSNYDPVNRTYNGLWDGTFKQAWHSNPAWVLYALMTNKRFGLGDLVQPGSLDKWGLYAVGQYCDGEVPDGKGGVEPRFTFNGSLRTRQDAIKVLDDVASVFRGMIYWGAGSVMVSQDSPTSPTKLVSPANIIGGDFTYTGTPLTSRSSSVAVSWNDPDDLGKTSVLIVQDDELIRKFGDRRRDVAAVGCTSRGQAKRVAEWILYTEAYESELVSYTASLDHADVRPGQIIAVADPNYAGARFGGRMVSATTGGIFTLDAPVTMEAGSTYSISVTLSNGVIKNYSLVNNDTTTDTVSTSDTISGPADLPQSGAMWVITATEAEPRHFRVLSNTEKEKNVYEISAVLHYGQKFAHIERDVAFDTPTTSVLDDLAIVPPASVTATMQRRPRRGSESQYVVLANWPRSTSANVRAYGVWIKEPDVAERFVSEVRDTSIEIPSTHNSTGEYTVKVRALSYDGNETAPVTATVNTGTVTVLMPAPTNWTAEPGFDQITLRGDASDLEDFAQFNVYGATSASATLTFLGSTTSTFFTRRPPAGDVYTRYKITQQDYSGNESAATAFINAVTVIDDGGDAPVVPTGLSLSSTLIADGQTALRADWDAVPNNGTTYRVRMRRGTGVDATYTAAENGYEWTVLPGVEYTVSVSMLNAMGVASAYSAEVSHTAAADTTAPATPTGVSAAGGFNTVSISWDENTENDLAHYEVFHRSSDVVPGANPYAPNLYTTVNRSFVLSDLNDNETEFVWVRAVDTSGNKSGWSAVASATTITVPSVFPTVGAPTGLAATTTLIDSTVSNVAATWDTVDNAVSYELGITRDGGNELIASVGSVAYDFDTIPGTAVDFRVRSVNAIGDKSAWSAVVAVTAAADSVPPGVPADVNTQPAFNAIWLNWSDVSDADLKEYEVLRSSVTNTPGANPSSQYVTKTTDSSLMSGGLPDEATRYFWVRSVDISGNKSAWSPMVTETTLAPVELTTEELQGLIDDTSFADGITGVEIVGTLPTSGNFEGRTVVLTTDGKLYRYVSGAWSSAVPAVDIEGQLTDAQIEEISAAKLLGTISSAQIASLQASKLTGLIPEALIAALAASKITGQLTDAQIEEIEAAKVAGQLTDAQIEEISAAKIVGQIVEDQIADEAVTIAKFASGLTGVEIVNSLPTTGNFEGRTVVLTTDGKLYRYVSGAWSSAVPAVDIDGQLTDEQLADIDAAKVAGQLTDAQIADIDAAKITGQIVEQQIADGAITVSHFDTGLTGVEIVTSVLPTTGNFVGRTVFRQSDGKLYRWTGSAWTAAISAVDIDGQLTDEQIEEIEAAKVAGQLTDAQIEEINAAKIVGQIVEDQIADDAITVAKFASGLTGVEIVDSLPTTGNYEGRIVFLKTDNKLYRRFGGAWSSAVPAVDIEGQLSDAQIEEIEAAKVAGQLTDAQIEEINAAKITGQIVENQIADEAVTIAKFASGLTGVEIVATLPTSGNFEGRTVILTTDGKLYRYVSGAWSAAVPAVDIEGQLTDAQIADIDAAKVAGQLTDAQLEEISAAKLVGNIVNSQIASVAATKLTGTIDEARIAGIAASKVTGQLSDAQIADIDAAKLTGTIDENRIGSISAVKVSGQLSNDQLADIEAAKITGEIGNTQIAGEAITASKIATNAVTAGKILAGSVSTAKLAADAVVANKIAANAITASKINADAVTADAIAANAVTADSIAANAVTAAAIEANAITAAKIASAAVSTAKLAAGAVVADKIAANAITAAKIAAGTITGAEISAGAIQALNIASEAVTSAKITAGAVTARKLAIGDFENLWIDTQHGDASYATTTSGATVNYLAGNSTYKSAGRLQVIHSAGTFGAANSPKFTIDEDGEEFFYKFIADIQDYRTGTAFLRLKVSATEDLANAVVFMSQTTSSEDPEEVTGSIAVPAGYRFAQIQLCKSTAGDNTIANFGLVIVRRKSAGKLIVDGSITTDLLNANAVTANKIAANAIVSDKIAANAITAGKISAGSVSTAKLAAGAVVADKIAADAVTAGKILSGAVTTAKLAADAVTADKIVANAITAGKIAAGAVNADEIASGAITARKLAIGDFDNLWLDENHQDNTYVTSGQETPTFTYHNGGTDWKADRYIKIQGAAGEYASVDASNVFSINSDGEQFYYSFEGDMENGTTGAAFLQFRVADNDAFTNSIGFNTATITINNGVETREGSITIPSGYKFGYLRIFKSNTGTSTIANVGKVVVRRKSAGKLIVDGSISTSLLQADSVTASRIATGAVTADAVAANAITAAAISAGAVSTSELAAGAVVADKIAANAITAVKIAAGAVEANSIATNAITSDKILANAITAGKIAAGAITADEIASEAVTAKKLAIGDFENLFRDANHLDSDHFVTEAGAEVSYLTATDNFKSQQKARLIESAGQYGALATPYRFDINPDGEEFYYEYVAALESGTTGSCHVRLRCSASADMSNTTNFNSVLATTGTPTEYSGALTIPAGYRYGQILFVKSGSGDASFADFGRVLVRRKSTGKLIVDGSIYAEHISTNAIISEKIAAGAIVADKIASNAITTAKLSAESVSTEKLATNAVVANKIAANAITATKISSGAVTADKIAANAVTASAIAADAVTAGAIAAGVIDATHIASDSITSKSLIIGDFSNLVSGADFEDKADMGFDVVDTEEVMRSGYAQVADSKYGTYSLRIGPTATSRLANGSPFSVTPGDQLYLEFWAKKDNDYDSNSNNEIRFTDFDTGTHFDQLSFGSGNLTGTGWQLRTRVVTVPDDCTKLQVQMRTAAAHTAGYVWLDSVVLRRMQAGNLIVDGAIFASKIAANAVTATKLAAGSVTADKIVSDAITSAKINANAVTAAKIAAGSVVADKIAANAITAVKIAADAIETNKIATNAVTADKIVANAITAGKIAAGAVNADEIASGAITARKLAIGNFDNLWLDEDHLDSTYASPGQNSPTLTYPAAGGSWNADKLIKITGTAGAYASADAPNVFNIDINGEEFFYSFEGDIENGTTGGCFLQFRVADNASFTNSTGFNTQHVTDADGPTVLEGSITIPAGYTHGYIRIFKDDGGTATIASVGRVIVRRKSAGKLIVDGSISTSLLQADAVTASRIAAGSVVADKIATNAITAAKISAGAVSTAKLAAGAVVADKIAADAITAGKIQAGAVETAKIATGAVQALQIASGAVATDKLAVGSGGNLLANSNWLSGESSFGFYSADATIDSELSKRVRPAGNTYTHPLYPTMEVKQTGTSTGANANIYLNPVGSSGNITGFPMQEGQWYDASVQVRALRCQVSISIFWRDISGTFIGSSPSSMVAATAGDTDNPDSWKTIWVKGLAPTGTTHGQLVIVKGPTTSGTTSFIFAHKPMLAKTHADATEPTPYAPSGATLISGSEILTGAVIADHIQSGAVTTAKLVAGAITADKIAANAVTANAIAANAITADKIAANAITAGKIAADAITSGKIAAGAVSADQIAAGAITADKLNVTDTTNLFLDGQNEHALSYLTPTTGTTVTRHTGGVNYKSRYMVKVTAPVGSYGVATAPTFMIDHNGEEFYYDVYADIQDGKTGKAFVQIFFSDNTDMSNGDTRRSDFIETESISRATGTISVPAGYRYGQIRLVKDNTGDSTIANFGRIIIRRKHKGELIVDGSIKANHVAANEIIANTANIKNAVITGAKIADAAITNAKIADATITSAKIQDIDAGKITVSGGTTLADWRGTDTTTIDGGKIETNSIEATSIKVGDFTNLLDGGGADTAADHCFDSTGVSGLSMVTGTKRSGGASLRIQPDIFTGIVERSGGKIPVVPGEKLLLSLWGRNDSLNDGTGQRIEFHDYTDGDAIITQKYLGAGAYSADNVWEYLTHVVTVPDGCAELSVYLKGDVGTAGYIWLDDIQLRKMTGGELIVAGGITANSVGTNEIITTSANIKNATIQEAHITGTLNGNLITANTITASQIAANAISTSELAADAVNAGHIQANAVTASEIAANTITAAQIATNTITATQIAGNTITAGQIAANAITTSELSAGSVTASKLKVGDGVNLIQNSTFSQGTVGWHLAGNSTIGNSDSRRIRNPGESYAGTHYPTLELKSTADSTSDGWTRVRFVPVEADGTWRGGCPVEGGEYYELSAKTCRLRCHYSLVVQWYDEDGTFIQDSTYLGDTSSAVGSSTDPESWVRRGAVVQAPANARYGRPTFQINTTTETSDAFLFIYKPLFGKSVQGADLMPFQHGDVTLLNGAQIKTGTISAGMGIFSGPLQSSDFNSGSAGWKIANDGTAEFNNLVTRGWIQEGAVSDGDVYTNMTAAGFDNDTTVATVTVGPMSLDQVWQFGFRGQFRKRKQSYYSYSQGGDNLWGTTYHKTSLRLQWRTMTGSTWTGWTDLYTTLASSGTGTAWTTDDSVVTKIGLYDDAQIRIQAYIVTESNNNGLTSQPSIQTWNNTDDITLIAKALVR